MAFWQNSRATSKDHCSKVRTINGRYCLLEIEDEAHSAAAKAMESPICFQYFALMKQSENAEVSNVQHYTIAKAGHNIDSFGGGSGALPVADAGNVKTGWNGGLAEGCKKEVLEQKPRVPVFSALRLPNKPTRE